MDNSLEHLLDMGHTDQNSTPSLKLSDLTKKLVTNSINDKQVGETFFKQGELRLLHGDISGVQFFDLALQLDASNPKLYFNQGLALYEFGRQHQSSKGFLLGSKRFKAATKLQNDYFEAWNFWGSSLYQLGMLSKQHHFFLEAEQKFKKAISLSCTQSQDVLSDLYWNYGSVWIQLSSKSHEPSDMHLALDAFSKAANLSEDLPVDFWYDYGKICLMLGSKLNEQRFFVKSIQCYKNAVSLEISSYKSWLELAKALKTLYFATHDEDHFTQANECFSTAAQLNSKDVELWIQWGNILCTSGRLISDEKRLRSAIDKCQKAILTDDSKPVINSIWSEALSTLGLLSDQVELIYEAQNKVLDLLDKNLCTPQLLYALGISLFGLGKYFNDLDFYYQAIEKFQEGLTLDRTKHKLWHALGITYTVIGQIEDDNQTFSLAHKFFQKALALRPTSLYYYDYAHSLSKYGEILNDASLLLQAKENFEYALKLQKNATYLYPKWLFEYGVTLDHLGEFSDERAHYVKALDILNHVLMVDPDFPQIHYQLALTYAHHAELTSETEIFQRALHHFRLAHKRDEENDVIILDWALTLTSFADEIEDETMKSNSFRDAEYKLTQAAKLGNTHAYYHLSCLYSLTRNIEKSMHFLLKANEFDALPEAEELLEDDWLENLRETLPFQNFYHHLESQYKVDE